MLQISQRLIIRLKKLLLDDGLHVDGAVKSPRLYALK